ncbi:TetR/AcrR family transcriptional regulator [Pseudohalocynthiibacter aestuariivivens]|uniref:TetR/AcrR family transcriptional regulator n=1 Tax=Pseudohalocynthiibacter aestuariivivens TaxID=1591409 RepID=A0ABV5JAC3_9RHOB|nr:MULTISPECIES: TetR/AcrR family transcriptional regulator [Pseudohalocynthiibacter]MBS9716036.1 TetR/AcrR family transcriptional regulator [Pseudohalocynthiibacter aestuariivivens]MCK0102406.1 TetR/AcrR family transcriptional regulator [Pseudohalocynthiibacter sp. F2068]
MARTIAKDYDQKRGQILKVAASVFATEGFDRASMSQLAKACGISKANIYHYYSGKDALLFDILDTYLKALRDRICNAAPASLTPEDRFRATVSAILLAYQGADDEHRVQGGGFAMLPDDQQDVLRGYQRDLVKHLSDIVQAIAPEVFEGEKGKLHAATMSVFGMLNWFYMWNSKADAKAREDYANIVSNLTLSGVRGL